MSGRKRATVWLAVSSLVLLAAPLLAPSSATAAGAFFSVDPVADAVAGDGWEVGADVEVRLGEKKPALIGAAVVDETGGFNVDLTANVKAGAFITVTDGSTSLEHTVTSLTMRSVDSDSDTVTGAADRGTSVEVGVDRPDTVATVLTDKTGRWSTAELGDLTVGMTGYAAQYEPDRSAATRVGWETHNPVFRVEPAPDGYYVWGVAVGDRLATGYQWPANTSLTAILDPVGAGDVATIGLTTDKYGDFDNFPGPMLGSGSAPGDVVTVTDGAVVDGVLQPGTDTVTKTLTVSALALDSPIDTAGDVVSGTAAPGSAVYVQPTLDPDLSYTGREVTTLADGTWRADFSAPSPDGDPAFDLAEGSMGYAAQQDEDGDATHVGWHAWVRGHIQVYPESDLITGNWWGDEATPDEPPHTTVTVSIAGDPASPYQAVADGPEDSFSLEVGYDLKPGDVVSATDGLTSKEHVVQTLTMQVDEATDVVSGVALDAAGEPSDGVFVVAYDGWATPEGPAPWRTAEVLSAPPKLAGTWSADFGLAGDDYTGSEVTYDIGPTSTVSAGIGDDDGDSTSVQWWGEGPPPEPEIGFSVDPVNETVWGSGWTPQGAVQVTVDGTPLGPTTADAEGWFWLDLSESADLTAGQTVVVEDGTTTKEHVVTVLATTGVDPATDTVTGVADPRWPLVVGVWDEAGQSAAEVEPSPVDVWTASFDGTYDVVSGTTGYAGQTDEDGDSTWIDWVAP